MSSDAKTPIVGRTGRRPGSSGSRELILDAARTRFARDGFAATTLRLIAADAGVDPALVLQFYGSKNGLFAATLTLPEAVTGHVEHAFAGDLEGMGERVVRAYLGLWEDPVLAAPLLAMVRSIVTNDLAADQLRDFFDDRIVSVILPHLSGDDAPQRAALAAAQLLGVAIARHILHVTPLASEEIQPLIALFAPAIQITLDGGLTAS